MLPIQYQLWPAIKQVNQFINFPLAHYFQTKWIIDSDVNDDRDKPSPERNLTSQKSAILHAN
jgi:hypothetical protein